MKIVTIGRGNIGGGLARLWRAAGHEVEELGREGGSVAGADAVLLAVPGPAIGEALAGISDLGDRPVIDATNAISGRPEGFSSLADYVKSITGGPVSKAFSANFARLFDQVGAARVRPSMAYASDDEAREVTEQLIRDAGYDPVSAGGLENARAVGDFLAVIFAVSGQRGPFFYRIGGPDDL